LNNAHGGHPKPSLISQHEIMITLTAILIYDFAIDTIVTIAEKEIEM